MESSWPGAEGQAVRDAVRPGQHLIRRQGCERTAVDSGGREEHCKLAKCGLYLAGRGGARMHPAAAFHDVRSRRWAGGHGRPVRRATATCCASGPLTAGLRIWEDRWLLQAVSG